MMKNIRPPILVSLLLFLAGNNLFSAVPVQQKSLGGISAASARFLLLAAAESYLGTPYRYGGLDRRGLDCSGLVYLSFRDALDISVPRSAEALYTWTEKIPAADIQTGDLVFFITTGPGISHVGIYTGNGRFIHAPSEGTETGVMYSRLSEAYWQRCFAGAGRALPWDEETGFALAEAGHEEITSGTAKTASKTPKEKGKSWKKSYGAYAGFGLSPSFGSLTGGYFFRGLATQAKIGYKLPFIQSSLEMRPEWDRLLGIYRLPITLNFGTDTFQIFGGPAYTMGNPEISSKSRGYHQGFTWLGELGLSAALPPLELGRGALSLFTEFCWQPYFRNKDEERNLAADLSANLRFSAGLRFLTLFGD